MEPGELDAWIQYFKILIEIEQSLEGDDATIEQTSGGSEG
jgi:hypothetical protein